MVSTISENNLFDKPLSKRVFWLSQLTFWTLYFVVFVGLTSKENLQEAAGFSTIAYLWPFLYCYFGLVASSLIKRIIQVFWGKWNSNFKLVFYMIGLPLFFAQLWYLWEFLLDKLFAEIGFLINPMHFSYYLKQTITSTLILIVWSGIYMVSIYLSAYQFQKLKTEKALLMAENAQLKMLRYQLNPHFLFNALGSTRALIREDQARAVQMVSRISDFLRYSLTDKMENLIELEDEFEAAINYIKIEQIQYGNKIVLETSLDPRTAKVMVPAFLIHPVVENAVKYGINTSQMPLVIKLLSEKVSNGLLIIISNSGSWVSFSEQDFGTGTGTGLRNVRERLEAKYPHNSEFSIHKGNDEVSIHIRINYDGKEFKGDNS